MFICLYVYVTTIVEEGGINLGEVWGHEEERYGGGDIIYFNYIKK